MFWFVGWLGLVCLFFWCVCVFRFCWVFFFGGGWFFCFLVVFVVCGFVFRNK